MSISFRTLISLLLAAALLPVAGAFAQTSGSAPSPTAPAGPPGSATAAVSACQVGADQADRSTTFVGKMVATATSTTMQMRFVLQERTATQTGFVAVSAPGLGVWQPSSARNFTVVREVTNLPAPARFRAAVSFRWLGATGAVVRQASRVTPICVQPDERPLLAVTRLAIQPSASSLNAQYTIALRNAGRGPAGPFDVMLTVNGAAQPDLVVQSLAAGTRTVLPVVAPRCTAGTSVVVTIDPQGAISEAPGGGLASTVACPFTASSSRSRD